MYHPFHHQYLLAHLSLGNIPQLLGPLTYCLPFYKSNNHFAQKHYVHQTNDD